MESVKSAEWQVNMQRYIRINDVDNVAVALTPLGKGEVTSFISASDPSNKLEVVLSEDIPQGHKFALCDLKTGSKIIKYANPIGTATADIITGSHVHTHNIKTTLGDINEYTYTKQVTDFPKEEPFYFNGYLRKDGRAGIRNDIWIIPTVGCVNGLVKSLERAGNAQLRKEGIDDIVGFTHPYGCSQMGLDQENTRHILADLIKHPNAGGVLVVGLGCENSNIPVMMDYLEGYDESRVRFLVAQDFTDEFSEGIKLLSELIDNASKDKRVPISSEKLIVGLKCGGSDGLSGITANPTVGAFSDFLIKHGGTTILTEVPEMFGAEKILMNRCANEELFGKTVNLINDFKDYFGRYNQVCYENPSPGNKKGGITTLEDKSLGCTQKAGKSEVEGVLKYSEPVINKGLNLLSAPGNDMVAATALASSGAQLVLFTTGRGTPFSSPVPTVKISSNTLLFEKKPGWIDFNAGVIVTEGKSINDTAMNLADFVKEVAEGKKVKSELSFYKDIAIFKDGVTC